MATFKKAAFVAAIALAFAFNACSDGSDGKNGANGSDGANGINGADGASCYVSPDPTQTHAYSVYCGNSPVGYIDNGQNGANGADGASCYVSEDATQTHAYLVYCGNLLVGRLNNGQNGSNGAKGDNGENGESCVASESDKPELGDIKITCGADVQYIKNGAKGDKGDDGKDGANGQDGADGTSCSVEEDEDKTTITCEDGKKSVIAKFDICNNMLYNRATHFCDKRDEQLYKYVTIGTQIWMAENLNFDASGSKCYDNDPANCAKYGRLYNWATAVNLNDTCLTKVCSDQVQAVHQGICPTGWHIPSDAEWTTLTGYVGGTSTAGTKLKSASGWNTSGGYKAGSDDYGFSALPGGNSYSGGSFGFAGTDGYWWSATEYDSRYAYFRGMHYSFEIVSVVSNLKDYYLFSVRCVRD